MKDVKRIIDIPEIENYLDKIFTLCCFDSSDNLQIYSIDLGDDVFVNVELISSESLIEGGIELASILIQDNIDFFQLTFRYVDNVCGDETESYCYRPLVSENEKDYLTDVTIK